jgi:hypothetical protein
MTHPLPLFVASKSELAKRLPELLLVRQEEWQSLLKEQDTGVEWIKFPLWDYHGPGPVCLRRGNPTVVQILDSVENSSSDSEVAAAAYYLVNDLPDGKENYLPLVEHLEKIERRPWSRRQARNAALAVAWASADKPFNHRDPKGKSNAQVSADYEHFKNLATRASALKGRAESLVGETLSQHVTSFE